MNVLAELIFAQQRKSAKPLAVLLSQFLFTPE
jgi:hypothetical protein